MAEKEDGKNRGLVELKGKINWLSDMKMVFEALRGLRRASVKNIGLLSVI